MAGVINFGRGNPRYPYFNGLFWQMTWEEWKAIYHISVLTPGNVMINVAEFLAALITCETFAEFCAEKFTTLEIDSKVAKAWLDSDRGPIYLFDRCVQAVHLFMMKRSMKLRTTWVPSGDNDLADTFSRERLSANQSRHYVHGRRVLKVKPR